MASSSIAELSAVVCRGVRVPARSGWPMADLASEGWARFAPGVRASSANSSGFRQRDASAAFRIACRRLPGVRVPARPSLPGRTRIREVGPGSHREFGQALRTAAPLEGPRCDAPTLAAGLPQLVIPAGFGPRFTGYDVAARDVDLPSPAEAARFLARIDSTRAPRSGGRGATPAPADDYDHADDGSNAWAFAQSRST